MNFSLVLLKAIDGGFSVVNDRSGGQHSPHLLFSGSIDECLDYLKKEMTADRDAAR